MAEKVKPSVPAVPTASLFAVLSPSGSGSGCSGGDAEGEGKGSLGGADRSAAPASGVSTSKSTPNSSAAPASGVSTPKSTPSVYAAFNAH